MNSQSYLPFRRGASFTAAKRQDGADHEDVDNYSYELIKGFVHD